MVEFFYLPSLAPSTQSGNLYTDLASDQAFINGGYEFHFMNNTLGIMPTLGLGLIKTSLDIHKESIGTFDNVLQGGITAIEIKKQDFATNLGLSVRYYLPSAFGRIIISMRTGYIVTFNTSDWSVGGSSDNVFGFNSSWPVNDSPPNVTNGFYLALETGIRVNLVSKKKN